MEENTFLKTRCDKLHGVHYICHNNSTQTYQILSDGFTDGFTIFSNSCQHDSFFYQACGHLVSYDAVETPKFHVNSDERSLCGSFVCETQGKFNSSSHVSLICNGMDDCLNTKVDEMFCEGIDLEMYVCDNTTLPTTSRKCDPKLNNHCDKDTILDQYPWFEPDKIRSDKVCDGICDCGNCRDESNCSDHVIGLYCVTALWPGSDRLSYLHPSKICNGERDCENGMDEDNCGLTCNVTIKVWTNPPTLRNVTKLLAYHQLCDDTKDCNNFEDLGYCEENPPYYETCLSHYDTQKGQLIRGLNDRNKCSVTMTREGAGTLEYRQLCWDGYSNYLNCTHDQALTCAVRGYPTTLSSQVICAGYPICDDGIESSCVDLVGGNVVHRHKLCDNVRDCAHGRDESPDTCSLTVNRTCVRRFPSGRGESLRFPVYWIGDGLQDCVDNSDEELENWKSCDKESYTEEGVDCLDYYNCGPDNTDKIPLAYLCDRINSCGNENEVCEVSRDQVEVWSKVTWDPHDIRIGRCLPGIHFSKDDACSGGDYLHPDVIFGESPIHLIHPNKPLDCSALYGGLYSM